MTEEQKTKKRAAPRTFYMDDLDLWDRFLAWAHERDMSASAVLCEFIRGKVGGDEQ